MPPTPLLLSLLPLWLLLPVSGRPVPGPASSGPSAPGAQKGQNGVLQGSTGQYASDLEDDPDVGHRAAVAAAAVEVTWSQAEVAAWTSPPPTARPKQEAS